MVIVGGTLLLTPGFITDIVGLMLLIPPTRDVVRRIASAIAKRRTVARVAFCGFGQYDQRGAAARASGARMGRRPRQPRPRPRPPLRRRGHRPRGRRRARAASCLSTTMSADAVRARDRVRRRADRVVAGRAAHARRGRARRGPPGGSRATSTGTRSSRCASSRAAFEDGRLLALVASRPAGAEGHDARRRAGSWCSPTARSSSSPRRCSRPSTTPRARRAGSGSSSTPSSTASRCASPPTARRPPELDDGAEATAMSFRLEGAGGAGLFERVSAGATPDARADQRPSSPTSAACSRRRCCARSPPSRTRRGIALGVARPGDAARRRARRRPPALRAREGKAHRGRVPRAARGRPRGRAGPPARAAPLSRDLLRGARPQRADGRADARAARRAATAWRC